MIDQKALLDELTKANAAQQIEQKTLNQTVQQLSDNVNNINVQFQELQQSIQKRNQTSQTQITNNVIDGKSEPLKIFNIDKESPTFYTIQLLGALQKESIISYVKQHQLSDSSKIYKTQYQSKPWFILVQGHYNSFSQASEQLKLLPEVLLKNSPWIKKLP